MPSVDDSIPRARPGFSQEPTQTGLPEACAAGSEGALHPGDANTRLVHTPGRCIRYATAGALAHAPSVYAHVYLPTHVFVHTYIYTYIYIYKYIHIHIHIWRQKFVYMDTYVYM